MAVKYSLLIYLLALPVFADEAPKLGVATNFGQNWSDAPFEASQFCPLPPVSPLCRRVNGDVAEWSKALPC